MKFIKWECQDILRVIINKDEDQKIMIFKHLSTYKFIIFLLPLILLSTLYAAPILDVKDISTSKPLNGPWNYAFGYVPAYDNARLDKQKTMLPKFFESLLGSPNGIITFKLKLRTSPNKALSIDMKQPLSVWKLYANNTLIGSSGELNYVSKKYKAAANYPIVSFIPQTETTTLVLYLANSQHRHIGFYGMPLIAPKGVLENERNVAINIEIAIASILVFFALYHIGLFLAWRKDKAPLWFGLLALSLAIRASVTGEKILLQFLPNISWDILLRLEYASGFIAISLFVLYVGSLYPKQTSKLTEYLFLSIGVLFFSFAIFTSSLFFTSTLELYEIVIVIAIIYTTWVLFQSYRSKENGSALALGALLFFSATIIHDILMFQEIIISSTDLLPYGFLIYLLAQATILLLRYADAFRLIESHKNDTNSSSIKNVIFRLRKKLGYDVFVNIPEVGYRVIS